MLSVLLGTAFLSRQVWGAISDRIGGLVTIFVGSAVADVRDERLHADAGRERACLPYRPPSVSGFPASFPPTCWRCASSTRHRKPHGAFRRCCCSPAPAWPRAAGLRVLLYDHFGYLCAGVRRRCRRQRPQSAPDRHVARPGALPQGFRVTICLLLAESGHSAGQGLCQGLDGPAEYKTEQKGRNGRSANFATSTNCARRFTYQPGGRGFKSCRARQIPAATSRPEANTASGRFARFQVDGPLGFAPKSCRMRRCSPA